MMDRDDNATDTQRTRTGQGPEALDIDRYVGYREPYATSREALDAVKAIQEERRNVAHSLLKQIEMTRKGRTEADDALTAPRRNSEVALTIGCAAQRFERTGRPRESRDPSGL